MHIYFENKNSKGNYHLQIEKPGRVLFELQGHKEIYSYSELESNVIAYCGLY